MHYGPIMTQYHGLHEICHPRVTHTYITYPDLLTDSTYCRLSCPGSFNVCYGRPAGHGHAPFIAVACEESRHLKHRTGMQGLAHPVRQLRKHAAHLARDAVAVLTGLRPAVMLDYVVLDGRTLQALGAALRAAAPTAGAGWLV